MWKFFYWKPNASKPCNWFSTASGSNAKWSMRLESGRQANRSGPSIPHLPGIVCPALHSPWRLVGPCSYQQCHVQAMQTKGMMASERQKRKRKFRKTARWQTECNIRDDS
mmetsp:Transcript_15626/g.27011  ORF Transcript_15626/g.27011 Transcript_15626/m.27011 type:complete len:110 (-) Transcript_15626:28-357(-)